MRGVVGSTIRKSGSTRGKREGWCLSAEVGDEELVDTTEEL